MINYVLVDRAFVKRCGLTGTHSAMINSGTDVYTWVPSTTAASAQRASRVPLLTVTKGQPRPLMSPVTEYPHAKFSAAQDRDRCPIFQAGARETRSGCEMTTRPTTDKEDETARQRIYTVCY